MVYTVCIQTYCNIFSLRFYAVVVAKQDPEAQNCPENLGMMYPNLQPYSESNKNEYITVAWNTASEEVPGNFIIGDDSRKTATPPGMSSQLYRNAPLSADKFCIFILVNRGTSLDNVSRLVVKC